MSQALIQGSPEMYIRSGSDINLSCQAKEMPEPPAHFTWYKGMIALSFLAHDHMTNMKVSIETEHQGLESRLLIRNAATIDSGNYTCVPNGAEPASIIVHVLNGTANSRKRDHWARIFLPSSLVYFMITRQNVEYYKITW